MKKQIKKDHSENKLVKTDSKPIESKAWEEMPVTNKRLEYVKVGNEKFIPESKVASLLTLERERLREKVEKLRQDKNKAYHIAGKVGKEPTNRGAIAQARVDGYKVALDDILDTLKS